MEKKIITIKPIKLEKRKNTLEIKSIPHTIQTQMINQLYLEQEFDESNTMLKELKSKQSSYKQQDITKKKYNETTFIKMNEIIEKIVISKLKCYYCRCKLFILYEKKRQPDQWTLDRLDNSMGHSNSNTVVCCLKCNLERRNKTSKGFKFAKQLVIVKDNNTESLIREE
jgi:hypothetical protein